MDLESELKRKKRKYETTTTLAEINQVLSLNNMNVDEQIIEPHVPWVPMAPMRYDPGDLAFLGPISTINPFTSDDVRSRTEDVLSRPIHVSQMFSDVETLLLNYPRWDHSRGATPEIKKEFHDLVKLLTPSGLKKKLLVDERVLLTAIDEELKQLVFIRNRLRHIFNYVKSRGKKQLIMDILAHMEGREPYVTGGGANPRYRRMEVLFHRESGVNKTVRGPNKVKPDLVCSALLGLREARAAASADARAAASVGDSSSSVLVKEERLSEDQWSEGTPEQEFGDGGNLLLMLAKATSGF